MDDGVSCLSSGEARSDRGFGRRWPLSGHPIEEHIVVTSASPLQPAARDVRGALEESNRHHQLLADSWRGQLRALIDGAAQCRAQGERAVCARVDELGRLARRMDQLAEALDWMLLDDR
jgi:hypothetical protein